jgi:hypothetical protein
MHEKSTKNILLLILGLIIALLGILIFKGILLAFIPGPSLPYILIGLGAGLFGTGLGGLIQRSVVHTDPAYERQQRIEASDERNQMLLAQAKARAYDVFIYAFGALLIGLALLSSMDWYVLLSLVLVYLVVILTMFVAHSRLQRMNNCAFPAGP